MLTLSGAGQPQNGSAVDLDSFIIQVNTANTGSGTTASNQFELPWIGTYDVDWGDGNTETGLVDTQTHTYSTAGTYDISVTATTGRIFFYNSSDEIKLIDIKQWGTCQWTAINYAFPSTRLTTTTATDTPNLTNVGSFRYMFRGSTIVDVTNINNWDVSNIADTGQMFSTTTNFIGDLSNWNTSNFQNIELMFRNNTSFNSDISGWDVSSVIDMRETFYGCTSFNQNISSWQVSQVTDFTNFMQNATGLSTAYYDNLLIAWDSQGAMSYSGTVDFGNSTYTLGGAAEVARTSLIAKWGGIVDGGGIVPQPFIIEINTANVGTSNNDQFTLPWIGTYDVDWGDGNVDTSVSGTQTHTYASAGTYDVSVTANTGRIYFNNGGDKAKLLDIKQWGTCQWNSMSSGFYGCTGLTTITATDVPDLIICTGGFSYMFGLCTNLISVGDNWDLSASIDSEYVFYNCTNFNGNINGWNLNGITQADSFFRGCSSFNQPLYNWDTSTIEDMQLMFYDCTSFNQNISNWDINQVTSFSDFMTNVTLSTANYDSLLITWNNQGAMSYSGTVNFGNSIYRLGGNAESARTSLISKWGNIIDGGGIVAPIGLLADYPNASAAYSLRNLISTNTNVVRVRRSSDNAEQDFSATEITDGTLTTFTGANDGFVTTWYDQSGNGRDATQTTTSKQPKIVSSGTVITANSKPTLRFDGSDDLLSLGNQTVGISTMIQVVKRNGTSGGTYHPIFSGTDGTQYFQNYVPNSTDISNLYYGSNLNTNQSFDTSLQCFQTYFDSTTQQYKNNSGSPTASATITDESTGSFKLGGYSTNILNGDFSEFIWYSNSQLSNRIGIEVNINNHYTIY